jgi:heme-degrading monooxygenase HmoA
MSLLMIMEAPGATLEQYDRTNEIMGIRGDDDSPDGLIQHVAGHDGNALVIIDVWESEEAVGRFFEERLGAALREAGIEPEGSQPKRLPVHNMLQGKGTEANFVLIMAMDDLPPEGYDDLTSKMPAHVADGSDHESVSHTAARAESGGVLVVDIWDSPESFGKFAQEQIAVAAGDNPLPPIEPRVVPVHNRIRGRAFAKA